MEWFSKLFRVSKEQEAGAQATLDEDALQAQSQAQTLRLELEAMQASLDSLKNEIVRLRQANQAQVKELAHGKIEKLLGDLAAPVTQLHTLRHLAEVEDKPLQARDVLAVTQRLVDALVENGLHLEGQIGDAVSFDPDRHHPLSTYETPQPGQQVALRFVGISYQGQLLQKAGVAPQ